MYLMEKYDITLVDIQRPIYKSLTQKLRKFRKKLKTGLDDNNI